MVSQLVNDPAASAQLHALWQELRHHLDAQKQHISQEIWDYPPPIPACDAQYNALLEARSAILHEIGRVNTIINHAPPVEEQLTLLNALLTTSPFVKGEAASVLQAQFAALQATPHTTHAPT